MKFRSINTCTVAPLPFLYPASSFLNLSSTPLLILLIIILHSISLTTESKVMPLQFVQCLVFLFFATCSLMISPHLKLFEIFSYSNILIIPSVDVFSLFKTLCHSAFCNSAVMESIPSAVILLLQHRLCLVLVHLLLSLQLCHRCHPPNYQLLGLLVLLY